MSLSVLLTTVLSNFKTKRSFRISLILTLIVLLVFVFFILKKNPEGIIRANRLVKEGYVFDSKSNTLIFVENFRTYIILDLLTGKEILSLDVGGNVNYISYYVPGLFTTIGCTKVYSFLDRSTADIECKEIDLNSSDREGQLVYLQQLITSSTVKYARSVQHRTTILLQNNNKYFLFEVMDYPYKLNNFKSMGTLAEYGSSMIVSAPVNSSITKQDSKGHSITLTNHRSCFVGSCSGHNLLVIYKNGKEIKRKELSLDDQIIPFVNGESTVVLLRIISRTIEKITF